MRPSFPLRLKAIYFMTLPDDDDNHDEDDVFRGDVVRFHFSIQSKEYNPWWATSISKSRATMFDFTCDIYYSGGIFSNFKFFPSLCQISFKSRSQFVVCDKYTCTVLGVLSFAMFC